MYESVHVRIRIYVYCISNTCTNPVVIVHVSSLFSIIIVSSARHRTTKSNAVRLLLTTEFTLTDFSDVNYANVRHFRSGLQLFLA